MGRAENPYQPPSQPLEDGRGGVERYEDVVWYRRSGVNSLLVLLGLCCGPFILAVCVILLTGDVYYNKHDASGRLERWSTANKVVAVIILLGQVAYIGMAAVGVASGAR